MKNYSIAILILIIGIIDTCFSQIQTAPSNERRYLDLAPYIEHAVARRGCVIVPIKVKNISSQDIWINKIPDVTAFLCSTGSSGAKVPVDTSRFISGGVMPHVLKPGGTITLQAVSSSSKLLSLVQSRKTILAGIVANVATSHEEFESYSVPIRIPSALLAPQWNDLGAKNYFLIVPDIKNSRFDGQVVEGGLMIVPLEITNVGTQPYIAATDSVEFYLVGRKGERKVPLPQEIIDESSPPLSPGNKKVSGGRSYVRVRDLLSGGYKRGDKVIAVVGGKIPNTNQIFECCSEPFELPPIPKEYLQMPSE